jgi:hypothetical protein
MSFPICVVYDLLKFYSSSSDIDDPSILQSFQQLLGSKRVSPHRSVWSMGQTVFPRRCFRAELALVAWERFQIARDDAIVARSMASI